jgi:diguanylate cyclase (GGDEF)-like protein
MASLLPPRPDTLACLGMAVCAVLSYALLGYAMRRMRSRDRLTVAAWSIGGVVAVGAGLWAMHALALATLVGHAPGAFQSSWLVGLAFTTAGTVAVLQRLAATDWPPLTRRGAEATTLAMGWWLQVEGALAALPLPVASGARFAVAHVPFDALVLVFVGTVAGLWVFFGPQRDRLGAFGVRLAFAGVVAGLSTAAGEWRVLQALRLPAELATADGAQGVDPSVLLLVAAGMLAFLLVGLLTAVLDRHTQLHHRALRSSLDDATRRLRDQAMTDPLTRMPNRLLFEERMTQALAALRDEPCSLAVLFIDLDGFKPINDSFGHLAGDSVLREVGRRLVAVSRDEDTVARVGGDEFLLMAVHPGHEAVAAAVAQRVLQALNEPFSLPGGMAVNLSASIGVVMFPEHGPASKLIANADAAMYAAKRAGGSTYAFFEPRMELDAREQIELQNELRMAIERKQLELYYQPKIHAESGLVTGVEALLRWHHPVRGFVEPGTFIPVAERFGLIGSIGNWVIDEACRQLRDWSHQGLRMRIAVNLSVHQLRQEDLVQRIRLAVGHFGVDPQLLTFEITESVAMEDTQETMKAFAQLANVGVSLSIDDFGTGYSSLSYLRKLPARQLKIDQTFVQDLGQSSDALAVVDAVIKLAHALGLSVVAEGVETTRQRDILVSLHCDELQGYLFAKPMSARLLTMWAMGEDESRVHLTAAAGPHADFRPSLFMTEAQDTVPMGLR